jgi:hypothetical protein
MWEFLSHIILESLRLFFNAIGRTTLGWILDTAFASSFAVVALHRKGREEGWRAMLAHFAEEYKAGLKFAVYSALIIYGAVAVWAFGKSVYEDHYQLTQSLAAYQTQTPKAFFAGNYGVSPFSSAQYILTTEVDRSNAAVEVNCNEVPVKSASLRPMSENGFAVFTNDFERIGNSKTRFLVSIKSFEWKRRAPLALEIIFQYPQNSPLSPCDLTVK